MRKYVVFALIVLVVAMVAAACAPAPAAPPVVQTVIVAGTPQVVQQTVVVPQVITATPPPGTPAPTAIPAPNAKNPGTLVNATIGEPESLDPAWLYETSGGEVDQNVYDTLVTFKKDSVTDLVGLLASKWDVSADGMTFKFTLRPEATFHSGNPVKASDVAYSFQRGLIQDRASGPQWILLQPFFGLDVQRFLDDPANKDDVVNVQYKGDFAAACTALQKSITADDAAGVVTMKLAQPYGPFLLTLSNSWGSVLEKAAVVKLGGWDGTCATASKFNDPAAEKSELFEKEVGSGPYKLARWDHGNEVDLVANDNYWLKTPLWDGGPSGAPKIKNIAIKNVTEWGTRYSMLLAGDADFANVPRANISQVDPLAKEIIDVGNNYAKTAGAANGFLRLFKNEPGLQMDAIFYNWNVDVTGGNNALGTGKLDGNGIPPNFFSDVHIRKAFNYCFDMKTFIAQYWKGEAIQAKGPILQGYLGYDANSPVYTYDIAKCQAEFDLAAKDPGFENVVKSGFFVQYTYNTGNVARQTSGQILKDGLAKANPKFRIGVADEPWAVMLRDENKSRLPLFQVGWLEDFHDPHDWVSPFLASQGTFSGTQGWSKALYAQMDDLITKAVSSTDTPTRAKLYGQLQQLAYDNAVSMYLEQAVGRHYEQTWIGGFYYNPIYPGFYYYTLSKGQ